MTTPLFYGTHGMDEEIHFIDKASLQRGVPPIFDLNRTFTTHIDIAILEAFEAASAVNQSMAFLYLPTWRRELFSEDLFTLGPLHPLFRPTHEGRPQIHTLDAPEQHAQLLTYAGLQYRLHEFSANPEKSLQLLDSYQRKLTHSGQPGA